MNSFDDIRDIGFAAERQERLREVQRTYRRYSIFLFAVTVTWILVCIGFGVLAVQIVSKIAPSLFTNF